MAERGRISGEICEALGLDPNKITRMVIRFDPSDAIIVEVDIYPDGDELRRAEAVFARYRFEATRLAVKS